MEISQIRSFALCAPLWAIMVTAAPTIASAQAAAAASPQPGSPTPTTDPVQNGQTVAEMQEVVVTAQKRSERLIDVPESVAAVSATDLAKLNATEFRDYANTVPGLEFTTQGAGQNQISIRGVTTGTPAASQTVGVYVDDVPYGASASYGMAGGLALDQGLFDLDHIEVLRGPQGTLYGASSLGGVLKYVTVAPDTRTYGGTVQAGVSSTHYGGVNYNGDFALNLPLVEDKAALRVDGYYSRDGGFIDNIGLGQSDVDRSRTYGGRIDLLLKPIDHLSVRIVGAAQNIERGGQATADYNLDGSPRYGGLEQDRIVDEPFGQQFRLVSGTIKYEFRNIALTSVSSYQTVGSQFVSDFSSLYVPLLGAAGIPLGSVGVTDSPDTRKFVQEIRLQSTSRGFFEWIVGGFYTSEANATHEFITATNTNGTPSTLSLFSAYLPDDYMEVAGFGNLTLHLTDKLQVTGGIRYAHSEQTFEQDGAGILIGSEPRNQTSDDVATYLADAQYRFTPDANVYFRYATGYRPGGPNAVAYDPVTGKPLAPPTFASDNLQNYEGGFKAQTPDRRFAINVDGYFIDWNDIQIVTARNGIAVVANATSGAHIYGSDLTATVRPTRDFTVTDAFGYIHSALTANDPDLGGTAGETLPNVPKFTNAVTADYVISDVRFLPRLGATIRYISDRKASFNNNPGQPQYDLGDYTSVDLRAGATIKTVDVQVFVRNVFDDRGQLSANTILSLDGGPAQVSILQPRTVGVSLSTHF